LNDAASISLNELIAEHGVELVDDPRRLEAFLRDYCPDCKREVFALLAASRAGVPRHLLNQARDSGLESIALTLAKHLEDDFGLSSDLALWAVKSWSSALGVNAPVAPGPPPLLTKAPADTASFETTSRHQERTPQMPTAEEVSTARPVTRNMAFARVPEGAPVRSPAQKDQRPTTQGRRRVTLLAGAGILVFLLALGAGALIGRADSNSSLASTGSTSATQSTITTSSTTTTIASLTTTTTVAPTTVERSPAGAVTAAPSVSATVKQATVPTTVAATVHPAPSTSTPKKADLTGRWHQGWGPDGRREVLILNDGTYGTFTGTSFFENSEGDRLEQGTVTGTIFGTKVDFTLSRPGGTFSWSGTLQVGSGTLSGSFAGYSGATYVRQ
jgi:hypothetical protein